MADLPGGTLTFLFSDIEGSTRLLRQLSGRYPEVLAEHQRVLRAAFAEHRGHEVDTEGDGFFVAFARPRDAIRAALAAQRGLASARWPAGVELRVRMGLHTGEAVVHGGTYVGLDVHRAARICAVGHGGQVLLSAATCALVADALPPDAGVRDLGEHRLKDFDRPERLYQLLAGDLAADFGPLRARSARGSPPGASLPRRQDRTVGREKELRAVLDRLRAGSVRLLTLTGPGGVGKTRLALEAARAAGADFADGARFISLSSVRRARDVPSTIVQALAIAPLEGESPKEAITRALLSKHLLLVLDNFEHVLAAAPFVSDVLLASSDALTVIATSREPLAVAAEQRFPVAPLGLPRSGEDLEAVAGAPAVALFAERARARDPDFALTAENGAAVVEICRRVDGLPLAIELAAARCTLMSPAEIAERLDAALAVLAQGPRDAPARQRTLRATIDWSVRLLTATERRAFERFAVFAGGATVQAAEAVTGATLDVLESLVAKHLLFRTPMRLAMLEVTREYAAERLARDPGADAIRERHARWCLKLAEEHAPLLVTEQRASSLSRLETEINNVRAALSWAFDAGRSDMAVTLAGALGPYWWRAHHDDEGRGWLDAALEQTGDVPPSARARALVFRGRVNRRLPHRVPERDLSTAAELFRAAGDRAGLAQAVAFLGVSERHHGAHESARRHLADALHIARQSGDAEALATALTAAAIGAADYETAADMAEDAVAALTRVGNVVDVGSVYTDTGYLAIRDQRYAEALPWLARALAVVERLPDPLALLIVQGNRGLAHLFLKHIADAKRCFSESVRLCRPPAFHGLVDEPMLGLAAVAVLEDDLARAARLVGAARAHADAGNTVDDDVILRRLSRRFLLPARDRYGPERWYREEQRGAELPFTDALELALELPPAPARRAARENSPTVGVSGRRSRDEPTGPPDRSSDGQTP